MKQVAAVVGVAAVLVLLGAGAAHAAAPRIIIVSGKPLLHQVVISNWQAIFQVMQAVTNSRVVPRRRLAGRPRLKISMFWGPGWNDYLREGHRASALRPRQADQFGSYYPAWRRHPALIDLPWAGRWPRVVPKRALVILRRFHLP